MARSSFKHYCQIILLSVTALAVSESSAGFLDDLFDQSKSRLETYNNVSDKALVDSFYVISPDGQKFGLSSDLEAPKSPFSFKALNAGSISFERDEGSESNMASVIGNMNRYSYDASADALAVKYIENAKSRGNLVKLYRPAMGNLINRLFKHPFEHDKNTREWYDLDNALIEFDKSGRPISFMVRAHQAYVLIGARVRQFTTIYFGTGNARHLENSINNSMFQESFIREL